MDDDKLSIIKREVKAVFPDSEILLFGSRARQENQPSSDYDLVIIIPDTLDIKQKWFFQAKIRKTLAKAKIPIDIIIQSKSELEINKVRPGHIVQAAMEEGIYI